MNSMSNLCEAIISSKDILILPHIIPDGDTIGSSVALYLVLEDMGKNPRILFEDNVPDNLRFIIPDTNTSKSFEDNMVYDLIIAVDCSDLERIGKRKKYIIENLNTINIDHHKTNNSFAKLNYIDINAAATGEIIYEIIKKLGVSISKAISTALYVAISTDTGSFKYDNTTPKTHLITSELLSAGINLNLITTELYQNKPMSKIVLLSEALKNLEFHFEGQIGIISVTQDILKKTGASYTEADGLIESVRDIAGVEVAVLLKEVSKNEIKVGFRSKYNFDVGTLAVIFGGGGHTKASGCTILDSIKNAKKRIISEIDKCFR